MSQMVKNPPANAGDPSSIPGLGRSPGEGNGNSLQYSCLENSIDRGAWQATTSGLSISGASLVVQMVKNPPAMWETWVQPLGWEDPPGGGHGNPLQYSCLENPHGLRSLEGYSPWGCKELDTTEQLSTAGL